MNNRVCVFCGKFAIELDNGVCPRCKNIETPGPIHFVIEDKNLLPLNSGNLIISREEWIDIKRKTDSFFRYTTDEKIVKVNEQRRELKRVKEEWYRRHGAFDGFIYLLKSNNGYYKIGRTKEVDKRIDNIRREYPIHIEILHQFPVKDYVKAETFLHHVFCDCHKQGDWFFLEKDQVEWIKSLDSEIIERLMGGGGEENNTL